MRRDHRASRNILKRDGRFPHRALRGPNHGADTAIEAIVCTPAECAIDERAGF